MRNGGTQNSPECTQKVYIFAILTTGVAVRKRGNPAWKTSADTGGAGMAGIEDAVGDTAQRRAYRG